MCDQKLYSAEEVKRICKVSEQQLAAYAKYDMVRPERISKETGGNLYTKENFLLIPIIKHYERMGFNLEAIKEIWNPRTLKDHEQTLRFKLKELEKQRETANKGSVYHRLAKEAEHVLRNRPDEVSIKYISPFRCYYLERDFVENYMELVGNLKWSASLERGKLAVEGPMLFWFDDCRKKMKRDCKNYRILQKAAGCGRTANGLNALMNLGGYMAASCYHIGSYGELNTTYRKLLCWIDTHGYRCSGGVMERCVFDFWAGEKEERLVTEILIPVARRRKTTASGKEE